MNVKHVLLVGAFFALAELPADAQYRSRYRYNYGYNNRVVPRYNYNYNYRYNYNNGFNFGASYGYRYPNYVAPYYYSTPSYYYTPPTIVVPQTTVLPATYSVPLETLATPAVTATEWGLRITELREGPAKRAGFRVGDVILKIDDQRVQSFENLREILTTSNKQQVDIDFIDSEGRGLQRRRVAIENGKIGVVVEQAPLERK